MLDDGPRDWIKVQQRRESNKNLTKNGNIRNQQTLKKNGELQIKIFIQKCKLGKTRRS